MVTPVVVAPVVVAPGVVATVAGIVAGANVAPARGAMTMNIDA